MKGLLRLESYRHIYQERSKLGICSWCENERSLTNDHIIPKSRGGTNDDDNKQKLCLDCHRVKSAHDFMHNNYLDLSVCKLCCCMTRTTPIANSSKTICGTCMEIKL